MFKGALKFLIYALCSTAAIWLICFVTLMLVPPFEWSRQAQEAITAVENSNAAIDVALAKDRDMAASARKLASGDMSGCNPGSRKGVDATNYCLDAIVKQTERQTADLDQTLVSSQDKLISAKGSLENAKKSSENWLFASFDQFKRFLKWLGPTLALTIAVIGALTIYLWRNPQALESLMVKVGDFQFSFQSMSAVRAKIADRFDTLNQGILEIYRKKLTDQQLSELFIQVKNKIDQVYAAQQPSIDLRTIKHRATLFVPGFIGEELIQATPYIGSGLPPSPHDVVGRRFSTRYGIIGRSWRQRHSLYNANVTKEKRTLVRLWGFTAREEADTRDGSAALACFALRPDNDGDPLGLIYLEGHIANAFGLSGSDVMNDEGLAEADIAAQKLWLRIATMEEGKALIEALRALRRDMDWDSKVSQEKAVS